MNISRERQGEIATFAGAFFWSLFPVITILSYGKLHPMVSLAGSLVFSGLFFAVILTIRNRWHELFNKALLRDVILVALFIGVLFYGFYFYGLKYTTAGNASIIALFEIFTSYSFFHLIKKEYIPRKHIFGAVLMLVGAVVILARNFVSFHGGDFIVLFATLIPPMGNYFQQRARQRASSEAINFLRTIFTLPFIVLFIILFQIPYSGPALQSSLWFFLINGIVLFGFSKILWLEGIHRISVTKANALSSVGPFFTLMIAWIFLHETPMVWQFLSLIPMSIGVILLTSKQSSIELNEP